MALPDTSRASATAPGTNLRGPPALPADEVAWLAFGEPRPDTAAVRLSHPRPNTVVATVSGVVDALTVHSVRDVLMPRVGTAARAIIIDLTAVEFIGVDGLRLLARLHTCAHHKGQFIRLISASPRLPRLMGSGTASSGPRWHTSVEEALGR